MERKVEKKEVNKEECEDEKRGIRREGAGGEEGGDGGIR